MVIAWCITMPAAGLVGALMWWIADLIGGTLGAVAIVLLLVAISALMWLRAHAAPINAGNVNDDWVDEPSPRDRSVGAGWS